VKNRKVFTTSPAYSLETTARQKGDEHLADSAPLRRKPGSTPGKALCIAPFRRVVAGCPEDAHAMPRTGSGGGIAPAHFGKSLQPNDIQNKPGCKNCPRKMRRIVVPNPLLTDICAPSVNGRFQELALGADHHAIGLVAPVAVPGGYARKQFGGQPGAPGRTARGLAGEPGRRA
jgi:hypothetical protein